MSYITYPDFVDPNPWYYPQPSYLSPASTKGASLLPKNPGEKSTPNPLDQQVGGGHYKKLAIQPIEYAMKNNLGPCEFNVVKYVTRWQDKGGIQDLDKAIQCLEILKSSLK